MTRGKLFMVSTRAMAASMDDEIAFMALAVTEAAAPTTAPDAEKPPPNAFAAPDPAEE